MTCACGKPSRPGESKRTKRPFKMCQRCHDLAVNYREKLKQQNRCPFCQRSAGKKADGTPRVVCKGCVRRAWTRTRQLKGVTTPVIQKRQPAEVGGQRVVRVFTTMTPTERDAARRLARKNGMSLSAWARHAFELAALYDAQEVRTRKASA